MQASLPRQLILFSWGPLLVFECSFNAHSDIVGIFFVVLLLPSRLEGKCVYLNNSLRPCRSDQGLFSLIVLLFLIVRAKGRGLPLFFTILGLFYLPFLTQGSIAERKGLSVFSREWEFNSALFGLLSMSMGDTAARITYALGLRCDLLSLSCPVDSEGGAGPSIDLFYGVSFHSRRSLTPGPSLASALRLHETESIVGYGLYSSQPILRHGRQPGNNRVSSLQSSLIAEDSRIWVGRISDSFRCVPARLWPGSICSTDS